MIRRLRGACFCTTSFKSHIFGFGWENRDAAEFIYIAFRWLRDRVRFSVWYGLPWVRGVEQYKDVREPPKLESRIGIVGIKSVFRRATLRITNGDVSLESSIKHHIYSQFFFWLSLCLCVNFKYFNPVSQDSLHWAWASTYKRNTKTYK